MKLNYDCVRMLLICLENNLNYGDSLAHSSINLSDILTSEELKAFPKEDIVYSTEKLLEAGYIEARVIGSDSNILGIRYFAVTFIGHQYIDGIRDNKVWKKVKDKILSSTSSITFDVIIEITKAVILGYFGLN